MKRLLVYSLCCLLLPCFSCSSSKPKPDAAETKATYGSLKLGLPGSVRGTVEPTNVFLTSDTSIVAMGASTGAQLSHAYRDKRHGLFTYYLLDGMRGQADSNAAGRIGLGELYGYVKENVERVSRRTTMEQVPTITPRIENLGDVSLGSVPAAGK